MPIDKIIPQSHILMQDRPADTVIAWREQEMLHLSDFRQLISRLILELQTHSEIRWALCCEDSYYFAAGLFALIYSGKTPIILGHLRESLLQEQAAEYDGLLTDTTFKLNCRQIIIGAHTNAPVTNFVLPDYPNNAILILFTSGSTGKPKAITKKLTLLERESEVLAAHFGTQFAGGLIASTVSHQHLYGLTFRIFLPLALGLPFDARMIQYHEQLNTLPDLPINLIASPAYLKRLDTALAPIQCNVVVSAGGPLSYEEAQRTYKALQVTPLEIYGTSETGVIAHRTQCQPQQAWQALTPIEVVADAEQRIQINSPLFEISPHENPHDILQDRIEIVNNTDQSSAGYSFHLLGRSDRIIKIEEKRISLTNVEQRLIALPYIQDACIIVLNQGNRQILGAVLVLTDAGIAQKNDLGTVHFGLFLRQTLRQWLDPISLPKRWRFVEEILLNTQSKRSYRELQELFL